AAAAMDTLYPAERAGRPALSGTARHIPALAEPAAARAWLDVERPNLLAVIAYAATNGWAGHAADLAFTVFRHLDLAGRYDDAHAVSDHALLATRTTGDRGREALALRLLANPLWRMGRYTE